jgi:heavy metal sensor kinase
MRDWWRRRPIRTRLTVWYCAVLLGILVVISASSYVLLRRSLIADLDVELAVAGQLVRDAGLGVADRSEAELRAVLGARFPEFFFQLTGPGGHAFGTQNLGARRLPLSPAAESRGRRGRPTFETVVLTGGKPVRLLTLPLTDGPAPTRFIQVAAGLGGVHRALAGYLETLGVLVPLGLGLSATGGAWLARSALAPVREMSRTARRITAEDLSQRLPRREAGDELDHLADTLNGMLARLEAAFDQVRRFAADAAHELRTPLTALKGGIEVALRAQRSPEAYRQVLMSSLEEVDRVIRLAEGLLLLSRVRMGAPAPRQAVELEPLLLEVYEVGARLAQGRGVSVHLGRRDPLTVPGDRSTLWRAVLNLVENAVRYTPAGGRVELALVRDGDHAVVEVRDTGVGIDAVDVERIFEPFVRLDAAAAGDDGGAGLGLSIVRAIVLAHGGTLSVQSAPGAGSTFAIRLPLG